MGCLERPLRGVMNLWLILWLERLKKKKWADECVAKRIGGGKRCPKRPT